MTTYVNDNGTWREISNLYVHDGTSFTNKTIDNAYVNDRVLGEKFLLFLLLQLTLQLLEI